MTRRIIEILKEISPNALNLKAIAHTAAQPVDAETKTVVQEADVSTGAAGVDIAGFSGTWTMKTETVRYLGTEGKEAAAVLARDLPNGDCQRWIFAQVKVDFYTIKQKCSDRYLALGDKDAVVSNIVASKTQMRWQISKVEGRYKLMNDWNYNMCLEAAGDGIKASVSACDSTAPWILTKIQASITGDPHVTRLDGTRFDLKKTGRHVLLRVPRAGAAKLLITSVVRRYDQYCANTYITHINVTGSWTAGLPEMNFNAEERFEPFISDSLYVTNDAMAFKSHQVKIELFRERYKGLPYLNFHLSGLPTGNAGGLLGQDSYAEAAAEVMDCRPGRPAFELSYVSFFAAESQ